MSKFTKGEKIASKYFLSQLVPVKGTSADHDELAKIIDSALDEQVEACAERENTLINLLHLINDEYDLVGGWTENGCEHGFKPASSCPNENCTSAKIQRLWNVMHDWEKNDG